eukprot:CAMPEP_0168723930 /NCGR_PEP_ID=MMETSP0724-20121128/3374_1 /TAXON_ID=265536 /ORGANISM="Amphiprora sp., Strain CCMP467" /LENGTH=178 /DNA_ID=CAMNT_0008770663 /DNA_START=169 /DNA_END=705 /DNA_ORIENTATION=+
MELYDAHSSIRSSESLPCSELTHDPIQPQGTKRVGFSTVSVHEHLLVSASQLLNDNDLPLLLDWEEAHASTRYSVDQYEYRRQQELVGRQPRRLSLDERRSRLGLETVRSTSLSMSMSMTSLLPPPRVNRKTNNPLQFDYTETPQSLPKQQQQQRESTMTASQRRARFAAMGRSGGRL